jgi:hypothetical protein
MPATRPGRVPEPRQGGGVSHVPEPPYAGVYKYVHHADVPEMQELGWELIGDMPGNHKFWSALMKWSDDGEPITVEKSGVQG